MTDTMTEVPAAFNGRPAMPGPYAELVDDWLVPNDLAGFIPDGSEIVVVSGPDGATITAPMWRHRNFDSDPWNRADLMLKSDLLGPGIGYDPDDYGPLVDERVVRLQVPVTDRIRELFAESTLTLVERPAER